MHHQSNFDCLDGGLWPKEFVTRRLTAMPMVAAGLTELQGVTVDFCGGPSPLARMYREQGAVR